MMYDHLCKHYELNYECEECKKDPQTCEHEGSEGSWHYAGDTLVKAWGLCYDCGKSLKLNREKMMLE
jgi:hypothetical protein